MADEIKSIRLGSSEDELGSRLRTIHRMVLQA